MPYLIFWFKDNFYSIIFYWVVCYYFNKISLDYLFPGSRPEFWFKPEIFIVCFFESVILYPLIKSIIKNEI